MQGISKSYPYYFVTFESSPLSLENFTPPQTLKCYMRGHKIISRTVQISTIYLHLLTHAWNPMSITDTQTSMRIV
jgi:hypothetical protein